MTHQHEGEATGWFYAMLAYGWWGFVFPLVLIGLNAAADPYSDSPVAWSFEILASRIVWCVVFCLIVIGLTRRFPAFREAIRSRKVLLTICVSSFLIACNWFGFIIGASIGRLSEASLGYYINPLFNVLLGYLFLSETLRRRQIWAVALAGLGVVWLTLIHGQVPWIAFGVATSFGFYGLVRKKLKIDALLGMTLEAMCCLPFALGYLIWRQVGSEPLVFLEGDWKIIVLLLACGPATALPLIWFAAAARRLKLATMGFIQFLAPTGQLIVALVANGESLSQGKLIGFVFIWAAVILYVWDAASSSSKTSRPTSQDSGSSTASCQNAPPSPNQVPPGASGKA